MESIRQPTPTSAEVNLSFQSNQSASQGPNGNQCDNLALTYSMTESADSWLLAAPCIKLVVLPIRRVNISADRQVEMFIYCVPEVSASIREELLANEEEVARELGVPHRVMNIAVGDLGGPTAKKYDIGAWFPPQRRYREITSRSNTTDRQARRLDIRFRRGGQLEFAHTLRGTGATARAQLPVMERCQDEGGKGGGSASAAAVRRPVRARLSRLRSGPPRPGPGWPAVRRRR